MGLGAARPDYLYKLAMEKDRIQVWKKQAGNSLFDIDLFENI